MNDSVKTDTREDRAARMLGHWTPRFESRLKAGRIVGRRRCDAAAAEGLRQAARPRPCPPSPIGSFLLVNRCNWLLDARQTRSYVGAVRFTT